MPETLIGRKLAAAVPRGGYVGGAQLAAEADVAGPPVRKGERAAEVVGLGAPDLVVPGARVDVLVTRDGEGGAAAATELALEDVEVLAARAGRAGGARRRRQARRRDAPRLGPRRGLPRRRAVVRARGAAAAARGGRPRTRGPVSVGPELR